MVVKRGALRVKIVGAADLCIAARIPSSEVALLQYRYIPDLVPSGQLVRSCQTVAASADNDHVIAFFRIFKIQHFLSRGHQHSCEDHVVGVLSKARPIPDLLQPPRG